MVARLDGGSPIRKLNRPSLNKWLELDGGKLSSGLEKVVDWIGNDKGRLDMTKPGQSHTHLFWMMIRGCKFPTKLEAMLLVSVRPYLIFGCK